MGNKDAHERRHDELVGELEEGLKGHYDQIWTFMEYCKNGELGEVDLLAIFDDINRTTYDFYEVKCTYTSKSARKANEQYRRFKLAFPEEVVRGFIYTGDRRIRRLKE